MKFKNILLFISIVITCFYSYGFDLKIIATDNHSYETPGTYNSNLMFQNLGTTNVQYFQIKWSLDDVIVDSIDIDILNTWGMTLQPSNSTSNYYFPLTIEQSLPLLVEGEYRFKMWVNKVHGSPDTDHSNDTISYLIHVVDYLPTKHVLLEKYSHTSCGPCYNGDLETIDLLTNYGHLSVVTIHNSSDDPMSFSDGTLLDNYFSTAHPNFVFDRYLYSPNTEYSSMIWNGTSTDLSKRKNIKEGVEVSIASQSYNVLTRDLTVTLRANFYANYSDTLAINAWITEDSVFGYQAESPDPFNYYHMHVARAILGGPFGIAITDATLDGNNFEYTFNYTIPSSYNENNIQVLGFIQRKNGSSIDVVNSTEPLIIQEDYISINELPGLKLNVYPNPTENSILIESDFQIISTSLTNVVGQLVLTGETNIIDLSMLTKGTYYLNVNTSHGIFVRMIEKL